MNAKTALVLAMAIASGYLLGRKKSNKLYHNFMVRDIMNKREECKDGNIQNKGTEEGN